MRVPIVQDVAMRGVLSLVLWLLSWFGGNILFDLGWAWWVYPLVAFGTVTGFVVAVVLGRVIPHRA